MASTGEGRTPQEQPQERSRGGRRLIWLAALVAALAAIALARLGLSGYALSGIESRLLDIRHQIRGVTAPPASVAIVAIDNETLEQVGRFPIPRAMIAQAITRIAEAGPRVIAVDLMFTERSGKVMLDNDDLSLQAALAETKNVVLATAVGGEPRPLPFKTQIALASSAFAVVDGPFPDEPGVGARTPIVEFAEFAELAHVNVGANRDEGALRRLPIVMLTPGGHYLPAISLVAAARLLGLDRMELRLAPGEALYLDDTRMQLDPQNEIALQYYGPSETIPTYSMIDVLNNPGLADIFAGKAVFIGATATGYGDRFGAPFDPQLPGVEALATLTSNLAVGETLRQDAPVRLASAGLGVVAALLTCWAAARRRIGLMTVASLIVWVMILGVIQAAFAFSNWWLDATQILLAGLIGAILGAAARRVDHALSERALARRERNLARYHSPLLTEALAGAEAPVFDGRPQTAAALFVDLAGYTARAETLGPEGAATFLKSFHTAVERAVAAHDGVIEQFAGDGAMAIFGLPWPRPDDAARALGCAVRLFDEMAELNKALAVQGLPPTRIRVGCHYGPAVAAVLGGARHAHVTVTGPTVNRASRLQEVAKANEVAIAISDALWTAAGAEARMKACERTLFLRRDDIEMRGAPGKHVCWLAQAPA